MAKKRPGSGKRPSQSGPGRKKPYVRKPPYDRDKAEALITRKFETVASHLRKHFGTDVVDTEIRTWLYQDGTLTADLNIVPLTEEISTDDVLFELHNNIDKSAVRGAWLSVGFYNPPTSIAVEDRAGYTKTRGQLFYKTHSRRWQKTFSAIIVEQARTSQEQFYTSHKAKPTKIVVRAWWSPEAKRPRRSVDKADKGKLRDDEE